MMEKITAKKGIFSMDFLFLIFSLKLLMSIAFPRSAVAVVVTFLVFFATVFADKNPRFTFLNLDAKHSLVIGLAGGAGFGFHDNDLLMKKINTTE